MAHTYSAIYIHIVFGTKKRRALLKGDTIERCRTYISALLDGEDARAIRVGGTADHLHILVCMHQEQSVATIVRKIKASSSAFLRREIPGLGSFAWQGGYGAFSVNYKNIDPLISYIDHQEEHHRNKTFEKEMSDILIAGGIEIDERLQFFFN